MLITSWLEPRHLCHGWLAATATTPSHLAIPLFTYRALVIASSALHRMSYAFDKEFFG